MIPIVDEIEKYLINNKIEISPIEKKEKWRLQQCWREKFSSTVRDWHTFYHKYYPHYSEYKAEVEFNKVLPERFVIAWSRDDIPAYYCNCSQAPQAEVFTYLLTNLLKLEDIYLFDLDVTWTMVFVHEEDFGPFFARSE